MNDDGEGGGDEVDQHQRRLIAEHEASQRQQRQQQQQQQQQRQRQRQRDISVRMDTGQEGWQALVVVVVRTDKLTFNQRGT
jgi:hypothetical protein